MEGMTLARLKELLEEKVAKAPSMKELAPTKQELMRRLGSICGVGPLDDDDAGVKCVARRGPQLAERATGTRVP
jgi:hypothetical protein